MGAIQAQDYGMAKWAIGLRLADASQKIIEESIDNGEIIRIHVLRPTWHIISADDVHWMIKLTASKVKTSFNSRHRQLELTEGIIHRTNKIIEKELNGGKSLTREELAQIFNEAKIKTDENRLSHILFSAELEGIICSGPSKSNKQTYALLDERVPKKKNLSREESIAELAKRYFTSHCPATIQDFSWWSNLSLTEIRKAVDHIKSDFQTVTSDSGQYLYPNSFKEITEKTSVHLLPAYDEFLISYRDRSSSLSLINDKKTVSDNGIFFPSLIVNGQVAGLWKRTVQKNKVMISLNQFQPLSKQIKKLIEKRAEKFGQFLNKEVEINL